MCNVSSVSVHQSAVIITISCCLMTSEHWGRELIQIQLITSPLISSPKPSPSSLFFVPSFEDFHFTQRSTLSNRIKTYFKKRNETEHTNMISPACMLAERRRSSFTFALGRKSSVSSSQLEFSIVSLPHWHLRALLIGFWDGGSCFSVCLPWVWKGTDQLFKEKGCGRGKKRWGEVDKNKRSRIGITF